MNRGPRFFDGLESFVRLVRTGIVAWVLFSGVCSASDSPYRDGDIIFQRSLSRQSTAISLATGSPYTHMGIIFFDDGEPMVYEAVQPVKITALDQWIRRGKGSHYVVKRLRDGEGVRMERVKKEVRRMLGRDYDWHFDWTDRRIYCSELVWKGYERGAGIRLSQLRRLEDFDLDEEEVKQTLVERYGRRVPLGMKVVAPSDIFDSDLLETVRSPR